MTQTQYLDTGTVEVEVQNMLEPLLSQEATSINTETKDTGDHGSIAVKVTMLWA